jgi:hypothetical protein
MSKLLSTENARCMRSRWALATPIVFCLLTVAMHAKTPATEALSAPPIQDNSFLVEEAYNQEPGVVQHINTFNRLVNSNEWAWTFTQEWPVPNHWKHQLSYTLTQTKPDPQLQSGFGDLLLNYRYQVSGTGKTRFAFAPRLTLIVPTGSSQQGTGYGGTGIQSCLPASLVLLPTLVAHSNLGGTWIPSARDAGGDTAASYGYFAGQSLIWLAQPRFNVLLESLWSSMHTVSGHRATQTQNDFSIVPGVRWAYNFRNGLQIVPGIAFVAGAGPSYGQNGVFMYLSFEHPLWREMKGGE